LLLDILDVPIESDYVDQIKVGGIEVKAQSKWLNALHIRGASATINTLKLSHL
jgi:hypothetical protein